MAHVISDLSKYALVVIMAIYTLECFAVFRHKDEEERNGIYTRQIVCMFLIHFIGFAAICLETSDTSYIIFYGFQQILLFYYGTRQSFFSKKAPRREARC